MFRKYFFLIGFLSALSFFLFSQALAGGCLDKSCPGTSNCGCERYRVDPGETITVYEHDLCQRATNQSGYPQTFIPTKTETEWNLFCTYPPSHISCAGCPPPILVVLNAGTGKSCNTICQERGMKCQSVGYDANATNQKLITASISCKCAAGGCSLFPFIGGCTCSSVIKYLNNCSCLGHSPTWWTYCRCTQ